MKKLITALKAKNRLDLVKKVRKICADTWYLPDNPDKIKKLNRYMIQLRAQKLMEDPIEFLNTNKLIGDDDFFNDLKNTKQRYLKQGKLPSNIRDYALEIFWQLYGYIEKIIARYKAEPSDFLVELDIPSLETMLRSL